jgi:Mg2+ and Co2+ transporter CorA
MSNAQKLPRTWETCKVYSSYQFLGASTELRSDHILALENSLSHYERMLSQSHPLYVSHIRTTVAISKGGSDKALIFLSAVSIGVLCIQTLIGK